MMDTVETFGDRYRDVQEESRHADHVLDPHQVCNIANYTSSRL
jgi:hypothetical protein